MSALPDAAAAIPDLPAIAARCQHIDTKTYRGAGRMDAFIAGFLSYSPAWIKALYGIRWGFVRLLGMRQDGMPGDSSVIVPEDVPMQAGAAATFFTVEQAAPERYWLASATDKHLTAYICITAEGDAASARLFHVTTLVVYKNWAGPVYFNVIRPFHHLVVAQMAQAGLRAAADPL